jgi:hypothetical protein
MTIIQFLNNWFKLGSPTLLDWFRLTSFYVIVLNYIKVAPIIKYQENFERYTVGLKYIMPTMFCVFLGLFALRVSEIMVLNVFKNKINKKPLERRYEIKNYKLLYFCTILVGVSQLYMVLFGIVGYGTMTENTTGSFSFVIQIISILSGFLLLVYASFKYIYDFRGPYFNKFYYFFLSIQFFYGFLSGMKETIIVPAIIVLITYLLGGKKIPKMYIYASVVFIVLIYPLNDNYRDTLMKYPELSKNQALGVAFVNTFDLNLTENINQGSEKYLDRLSLLPFLIYSLYLSPIFMVYTKKYPSR